MVVFSFILCSIRDTDVDPLRSAVSVADMPVPDFGSRRADVSYLLRVGPSTIP